LAPALFGQVYALQPDEAVKSHHLPSSPVHDAPDGKSEAEDMASFLEGVDGAGISPPQGVVGGDLAHQVVVLEDPSRGLDLDGVLALPAARWQPNRQDALYFGLSTSAWWVRFTLLNDGDQSQPWVLELDWPLLDWLDIYLLAGGQSLASWHTGDQRPFASRPLDTRVFAIPLTIPPGARCQIVMRLALSSGIYEPIRPQLWEPRAFHAASQWSELLAGAYYGALLALFVFYLLLFFSTWHRDFLLYAIYLALMVVWNMGLLGYGYQYLWPDQSWWNNQFNLLLSWLASVGATLFVVHYLETRRQAPRLHRFILGLTAVMAMPVLIKLASSLGWGLSLPLPLPLLFVGYILMSWVLILLYLVAGMLAVRQGFRPARWFVLAWTFLVLGILIFDLSFVPGLIPRNPVTENSINFGSSLEFLLLALALGSRFNQLRDDKLAAERRTAELQSAHAALLELQVAERTQELHQAISKVESALEQERRAQVELREFLAGVSHELRTPLTVIDTIAQNLEIDGDQADDETRARYRQIQQVTARMSILLNGYLDEERFTLLRQGPELLPCDLRALLMDTLHAAQVLAEGHRLRVEVGDLPERFLCDPQLTRLALHNLADNAVKYTPPGTEVVLCGQLAGPREGDGVWLDVIDKGAGMKQEKLAGLFDPRVRGPRADTRTGKGLGLYLARRMIETQGGTLTATGGVGQGCHFRIWLPG